LENYKTKNITYESNNIFAFVGVLHQQTKDRKYQIWERNPFGVELRSRDVFKQKLNYIHFNPVRAGLCPSAMDYLYSSASF
jgi:putative transposase